MSEAAFTMDTTEVEKGLTGMAEQKPDILRSFQNFMLRETQRRFRNCETPDGTAWPASRFGSKRGGGFSRTLYGRGDLFRSIEPFTVDDDTVGVGTDLVYAKTHQEGAKFTASKKQSVWLFHNVFRPAGGDGAYWSWHYHITIPKRKFLGISENDQNELVKIAEMILMKGFSDDRN